MNCSTENGLCSANSSSIMSVINGSILEIISYNDSLSVNSNNTTLTECDEEYVRFRDQSRFWIQRVLVPIIMIIGVIGNSITIVIMTRRKMRSSTNSYLAALATFDMLYLIFIFVLSLSVYPNIKDVKYLYYWKFWPFAIMVADASSNTSIWLTVTFTIERYIAVCHPIKGKVLCTESRAKRVILCVFIICFTFTIPTPFEWTVLERNDTKTNTIYLQATFSDFGQNDLYKTVYYYLNVILFALIPFLLLAIFNAFLIRSVHISRKQRNTMIQGDSSKIDPTWKQESRITIMLIAVVILFFLCQLPTACVLIYSVFYTVEDVTNKGCLLRGLGNIFNFLMAINAAGNFVLYCLLSQKYRRTFVTIFCPCFKGKFLTMQSAYQRTVYTQVADHNIHHFRDNELNHRFNYNLNTTRRLSSPRSVGNQQFNSHLRLSSGSLAPYLSQNTCALRCSRSANYLQVPSGSCSNLMYESSGSVSPSLSGDEESNISTEFDNNTKNAIDSNHQKQSDGTHFQAMDSKTINNCKDILNISQDLSDKNFHNNNNNKLIATNLGDLCDSNRSANKATPEINGLAVMLAKNAINSDSDEAVDRLDCDHLNTNVSQIHNSQLNNKIDLNRDKSFNKFQTTAVVNNTTQL